MSIAEKTLKAKIDDLQGDLDMLRKNRDDARSQYDSAKTKITRVERDIQSCQDALDKIRGPVTA